MDLFVEKYRPRYLDDFVGDNTVRTKIQEYLNTGKLQNLLLFGPAGTGKTSLAKLIVGQLGADHLYINASDERGIDTIRDKIIPFASSIGFNGLKVVILDESDYLTAQAQATLRNVMESFSNSCRFILTCNYLDRIISPLQSRCMAFGITPPSKKEVGQHILQICESEGINYTKEDLGQVIITHYPDIRKILNTLQGSLKDNELILDTKSLKNTDFEKESLTYMLRGGVMDRFIFNILEKNRSYYNQISQQEFEEEEPPHLVLVVEGKERLVVGLRQKGARRGEVIFGVGGRRAEGARAAVLRTRCAARPSPAPAQAPPPACARRSGCQISPSASVWGLWAPRMWPSAAIWSRAYQYDQDGRWTICCWCARW